MKFRPHGRIICRIEAAACITEPIGISMAAMPDVLSVMTGKYQVRGVRQMDAKIRQFPRGTRFFSPTAG
ncbi:MAG: hypothetical protein LAP85_07730 [Acidobacteriia bacterium]|nr:hypothetical protein [Terriglobia bacterium]